MSFAQESFENAFILKILVSMDRAQSGELGTLYFYSRLEAKSEMDIEITLGGTEC